MRLVASIGAAAAALVAVPAVSAAFCGFYVSGAGADLFNNATQVVLMRQGTRTVLAMQNNYQGPPEDFALVVPVPMVLQKENVKTLPREVFRKVDSLAAPRLVEYWEQDPCEQLRMEMADRAMGGAIPAPAEARERRRDLGVKVEARFAVGEYQIVILSARDSTGLDTWLRQEKYAIPAGAQPYLEPYVAGGSKFFVAKVDASKVKFENGQAMLSPLRFHYDSEEFSLPIRLGMMNSAGTQDLIVHILAPGQRYEVANYSNVTIPTNLDVAEEARDRFGEFYAALLDRTLEKNRGAVVTEYAWDASSCDPCPTPALDPGELATLGADVLTAPAGGGRPSRGRAVQSPPRQFANGFVLTRLHARYTKGGINEDLVFKAAPPIAGGREWAAAGGALEVGAVPYSVNNFQARYAIRHPWTGPIACDSPRRGVWGGPPGQQIATGGVKPALDLAFVPRGKAQLARLVRQDIPEIGVQAVKPAEQPGAANPAGGQKMEPPRPTREKKGCAAGGDAAGAGAIAVLLAGLGLRRFARRRAARHV
ncbi:MAG TPA: DUF2330 domain-containing protein [Kofleriaceae bacterium]|nr:DUF2330 domain-containing protein [Kofleriaceae bacterium]